MQTVLDNGLILRTMSDAFREALADFYVDVFVDEYDEEDKILGAWTQDLVSDQHPTVTDDDIFMITDPAQDNRIVSALLNIPQVWEYDGLSLPVARIELVATHKDYRHRGLIRTLMNTVHAHTEKQGAMLQVITGISHYYRQFGYAMTLKFGSSVIFPFSSIPLPKPDTTPRFKLRAATTEDIPNLIHWRDTYRQEVLLSVQRSAEVWSYELTTRQKDTPFSLNIFIVENQQGVGVGYVILEDHEGIHDGIYIFTVLEWVIGETSNYLETYRDILAGLRSHLEAQLSVRGTPSAYGNLWLNNGLHPILSQIAQRTYSASIRDYLYAWYIRVPDAVALLRYLQPILEARLAASGARGYSGTLKISFYNRDGLTLTFDNGKITQIDGGEVPEPQQDVGLGYHSFWHVVFGHHSLEDIKAVLPDTAYNAKAIVLLTALFPKKPSWIIGLG